MFHATSIATQPDRSPANRADAERAYAQGVQGAAIIPLKMRQFQSYLQAVSVDPAFFDAQANLGLAAHDAQRYQQSLVAFETALAIKAESTSTRYNFALTLRDAGYLTDAAEELEKVVAADASEVNAAICVGESVRIATARCAESPAALRQSSGAESAASEATNIRFWLAANPK